MDKPPKASNFDGNILAQPCTPRKIFVSLGKRKIFYAADGSSCEKTRQKARGTSQEMSRVLFK